MVFFLLSNKSQMVKMRELRIYLGTTVPGREVVCARYGVGSRVYQYQSP